MIFVNQVKELCKAEVVEVMTLDYTFERQIMLERKEAYEEGYREGFILGSKERGLSYDATAARVKERFSLSDAEVEENMRLYW